MTRMRRRGAQAADGPRAQAGTGTPAIVALAAAGIPVRRHDYEHDARATSFGAEAATALGVDAARVFKTLVVATTDDSLAVAVVPVDSEVDFKATAVALGIRRASMADPAVAQRRTGYVVGGISPIGQRIRLPTVVDDSAREHATVFVSGGRRGLELELTPDELLAATGGALAPIARHRPGPVRNAG